MKIFGKHFDFHLLFGSIRVQNWNFFWIWSIVTKVKGIFYDYRNFQSWFIANIPYAPFFLNQDMVCVRMFLINTKPSMHRRSRITWKPLLQALVIRKGKRLFVDWFTHNKADLDVSVIEECFVNLQQLLGGFSPPPHIESTKTERNLFSRTFTACSLNSLIIFSKAFATNFPTVYKESEMCSQHL